MSNPHTPLQSSDQLDTAIIWFLLFYAWVAVYNLVCLGKHLKLWQMASVESETYHTKRTIMIDSSNKYWIISQLES
jgi:hypothetical protein